MARCSVNRVAAGPSSSTTLLTARIFPQLFIDSFWRNRTPCFFLVGVKAYCSLSHIASERGHRKLPGSLSFTVVFGFSLERQVWVARIGLIKRVVLQFPHLNKLPIPTNRVRIGVNDQSLFVVPTDDHPLGMR